MNELAIPPAASTPVCTRQGEYAILCDAGAGTELNLDIQRKVWAASARLTAREDVLEVVPGMNNFLVIFRGVQEDFDACRADILCAWSQSEAGDSKPREVTVPVIYGGQTGEDLQEVARRAGMGPEDYVALHAQATYVVYALGSQPGFAYLGGLDPRLAIPRRDTPRPRVEAGSVIIGGAQTGILSRTTPSGWHIIGRTELNCFDHTRERPALLEPGDTVRFTIQEVRA